MSTLVQTLAPPKDRRMPHVLVLAGLAFAGSLLMGMLSQASIRLPFTPVPITGQTLGVLLIGACLGSLWGSASMLMYLIEGGIGLHFFAAGGHGWNTLAVSSPSGGYLWGFLIATAVVGWLAKRGWDRDWGSSIGMMFVGELIIYAFGIPWLMASLGVPLEKGLEYGLYPFVIGDALKLMIAAGLLPAAWKLTGRRGDDETAV